MNTLRKIWQLLTPRQRRSTVVLYGLMLIGMALETLGVGMVIPALALMTQSDLVARYPAVAPLMQRFGNPDREHLVIAGMLLLVALYLLKTTFLVFLTWRQMRFAFGVQAELSQRLFAGYLRQPYTFHLQRNSAQLIRNAVGETDLFTKMALTAGLMLITEMLVVFGISVLLLIVEPLGALVVVGALGIAGWSFHRITHQRILRWGAARQLHEGQRIQHLQQGLGGVKDVKLLGREKAFLAQYREHSLGSARAGRLQSILQQMPRLVLEFLAVSALATLVLIMIGQDKPLDSLLPTLGLFAAAAFRLMPSATRVMSSAQNVRYSLPIIEVLHNEIRSVAGNQASPLDRPFHFRHSLELDSVAFQYPLAESAALRDVTFTVRNGASIGIIGGSGAGKSTLVDIILGLFTPTTGTVRVDGLDIQTNLRGWQDLLGYVPQSVFLTDDTLRRNVAFGLADEQIDDDAVWRAIRAAQLEGYVKGLPQGLQTMVGERGARLSGGQLQRVGIARALYHDPPVLVLDEATSSLDTTIERGVMEAVRALHGRKTVLIVAHRLSTVEHCDRLYRLEGGHIVDEGIPADVLADSKLAPNKAV